MVWTITLCWAADNGASIQAHPEQASSNAGSSHEADAATGDKRVEATAWAMLQAEQIPTVPAAFVLPAEQAPAAPAAVFLAERVPAAPADTAAVMPLASQAPAAPVSVAQHEVLAEPPPAAAPVLESLFPALSKKRKFHSTLQVGSLWL